MKITIREIQKYTDNWERFCHIYGYDPDGQLPGDQEHEMTIQQMDNLGILTGILMAANEMMKGRKS